MALFLFISPTGCDRFSHQVSDVQVKPKKRRLILWLKERTGLVEESLNLILPEGQTVAQPAVEKTKTVKTRQRDTDASSAKQLSRGSRVFDPVSPASGRDEPATQREQPELPVRGPTGISEDTVSLLNTLLTHKQWRRCSGLLRQRFSTR